MASEDECPENHFDLCEDLLESGLIERKRLDASDLMEDADVDDPEVREMVGGVVAWGALPRNIGPIAFKIDVSVLLEDADVDGLGVRTGSATLNNLRNIFLETTPDIFLETTPDRSSIFMYVTWSSSSSLS